MRSHTALRRVLTSIGEIGNHLSQARDAFLGLARIVPFVLGQKHPWIVPEFEGRLGAVAKDFASSNDYESHLSNKVQLSTTVVPGDDERSAMVYV
jgi:hypothetical protein